jgi:PhnB protein
MVPAGWDDKIMHSALRIGTASLMASDGCSEGGKFEGFSLSLTVASEAEARKKFDALAQDGQVRMPLGKTFWSPCFGMVTDRFGIGWMIGVEQDIAALSPA